ncbi:ras-related protein Rab-3C isoform X2 [Vicugna pacos]|uniref:small monomeric GTPase n=1 Tax=Vicugna pacos TaxID=30538 RepID=A0ABM5D1G7_VICPA
MCQDTAGQERYRTITTAYYRGAMGFILMYDITNEESFNAVQDWSTQIKTYSWDNAQVILVGNKCDMEDERVISTERGKHLGEQLGEEGKAGSGRDSICTRNSDRRGYVGGAEGECVLSFLKQVPRITLTSSRHLSASWISSATKCQRVWRLTQPSLRRSRTRDSRTPRLHRSPAVAVNVPTQAAPEGWLLKTAFINGRLAFTYTA